MEERGKPKALARRQIYASRWVNLWVDRVQFPNGRIIEKHHLLDFERPSVMTVPRDDAGRYLMVQVPRYPTGRAEWEFPAGSVEPGESVLEASLREVQEETGCDSTDHRIVYEYHPMNGIANQVFYVARCRIEDSPGTYDEAEISAVRWFSGEDIWEMVRSGEMKDGYALTAFLLDLHLP